jgi:hypothetical protein
MSNKNQLPEPTGLTAIFNEASCISPSCENLILFGVSRQVLPQGLRSTLR